MSAETTEYRERENDTSASEMPRYRRDRYPRVRAKDVHAQKISGVKGGVLAHGDGSTKVSEDFIEKHRPKVGGFFVVHVAGGRKSYLSSKAFSADYTALDKIGVS